MKKYAIQNTLSQAWYLGRAFYQAAKNKTDVVHEMVGSIARMNAGLRF